LRRCFVAVVGIVEFTIKAFETSAEMVVEVETMMETVVVEAVEVTVEKAG
jgi:hypothetical protein